MIRYIDISNQIAQDQFNFCWYDTVTDKILNFSGEQVFDSWNDFEFYFFNFNEFGDIERFRALFPKDKIIKEVRQ